MIKNLVGGWIGLVFGLGMIQEAWAAEPPQARTGFQMALRTGYSQPFGGLLGETGLNIRDIPMSDFVSGQIPFIVDIGAKVMPEVFIGGYVGLSIGGVAGAHADDCDADGKDCRSSSFRFGVEGQYHFLPANPVNPWLGYGIGIESLTVDDSVGQDGSFGFVGLEFAHFMGGVDFRVSRVAGIGPFLDISMGNYSTLIVRNGDDTVSGDLAESVMHTWLTFGVRVVFFP